MRTSLPRETVSKLWIISIFEQYSPSSVMVVFNHSGIKSQKAEMVKLMKEFDKLCHPTRIKKVVFLMYFQSKISYLCEM